MSCNRYASDEDYVEDIRKGGSTGQQASDCLYRTYHARVLDYMQRYVGPWSGQQEDVRDLLQDAYLLMIKKIRFGGYNHGSLVHFWTGIAKGMLKNKVRRDARTDLKEDNSAFDVVDFSTPEEWVMNKEQERILMGLLESLGERCRDVLMLWAAGYSMREIVEKTGISSEAMARKTKFRCKNKLVALIKERNIDYL